MAVDKTRYQSSFYSSGNTLLTPVGEVDNDGHIANKRLDGWGKQIVVQPEQLANNIFRYNDLPEVFDQLLTGNATITHNPNISSLELETTTASGDIAQLPTRKHYAYQTGAQLEAKMAVTFDNAYDSGYKAEWGLFNDSDGLFFRVENGVFSVVVRESTTGSVQEHIVNQSNFELDKVDGSQDDFNQSGYNIDLTKMQMYIIRFNWYSAGDVIFSCIGHDKRVNDRTIINLHIFRHNNINTRPYLSSPYLPMQTRVENKTSLSSGTKAIQAGSSIFVHGKNESPGYDRNVQSQLTTTNSNNEAFLLAVRCAPNFPQGSSIINRGVAQAVKLAASQDDNGNILIIRLYKGLDDSASISGGTWVAATTNSIIQISQDATGFDSSNDDLLYTESLAGYDSQFPLDRMQGLSSNGDISRSYDNNSSAVLYLTVQNLSNKNNVNILGSVGFKEFR